MYDIKSIALDLEVTVQTIYNHIKKNHQELRPYIFKKNGSTYLTEEAIVIIKKSMGLIKVPEVQQESLDIADVIESISMQVSNNIKNDLLKDLKEGFLEHSRQLQEQYEVKLQEELLKQEERIIEQVTLKQQEQLIKENDRLLKYISNSRETKKSFFSRLFSK